MAKKTLALILAIITILSCILLPANAATCSSGTRTRTITVKTKANWACPGSESITLAQSKGKFSYAETTWYGAETGKTKTKTEYATWKISVASTDGSHSYSRTWCSKSIKLNLKPNKTYHITISYDGLQDVFRELDYRRFRWNYYPSWSVRSTWKVSRCY